MDGDLGYRFNIDSLVDGYQNQWPAAKLVINSETLELAEIRGIIPKDTVVFPEDELNAKVSQVTSAAYELYEYLRAKEKESENPKI